MLTGLGSLNSVSYALKQYLESKGMIVGSKKIKSKVRHFTADITRAYLNINRKLRVEREMEQSVEIFGFFLKKESKDDESQGQAEDKNAPEEARDASKGYTVEQITIRRIFTTPKDSFNPQSLLVLIHNEITKKRARSVAYA